jgi:hypothetical protein
MSPFLGRAAFGNYKDADLTSEDWATAYWGAASVDKLRAVKCAYDPSELFSSSAQSISVSASCVRPSFCLATGC